METMIHKDRRIRTKQAKFDILHKLQEIKEILEADVSPEEMEV
jgi:hypothetical protein